MEVIVVVVLIFLLALVILPVWSLVRSREQNHELHALRNRVNSLEAEIRQLRPTSAKNEPAPAPPPTVVVAPRTVERDVTIALAIPVPPPLPPPVIAPPPLIAAGAATLRPDPFPPSPPSLAGRIAPPPSPKATLNWEQFLGAKLFAWLGGLALFLGVAFFVKYSVEHQWIPPEIRVALGFVFGAALVVGGLKIPRGKYSVTAQTLIAAGVVSLYAVTFSCGKEHYNFLGPVAMFLVMALITATAFFLAVRLQAQVIAILGLLGGFLTPILLSTGVDNPGGLFGYLALLDAGLIAVVLATGWRYLLPLSAGGTVAMMLAWAERFLTAEKGPVAMIVCVGFGGLYLAAFALARRRGQANSVFSWTTAALPLVSFGFGFALLAYPAVAARGPLFFGFVLLLDLLLLAQAWYDEFLPKLSGVAGLIAFALLGTWTMGHLTDGLLPAALAGYLVFAALHTIFPLLLQRHRPTTAATGWTQVFPPLCLLLMILPLAKLDAVSFVLWPAILLVDLLAVAIAFVSASLAVVAAVLVLTLLATGLFIFKVPTDVGLEPSLLLIIGGFAVFFFGASLWLARRLGPRLPGFGRDRPFAAVMGDPRSQLPAFSSLLPFLLLIMACTRLNVPNPSALFGLGLLLVALTLGVSALMVVEWLPACALAGMTALEFAWRARHVPAVTEDGPLAWYWGFYAVFAAYPFVFRRRFAALTGPWAVAALSGVAHFYLVYEILKPSWPADLLGLIPALFAVAPFASLGAVYRTAPVDAKARLNQLAWFGGVALFFITLIVPIQFERQWLTVAWALEGAALLGLFHRVPHPGLRATGVVLLATVFVRLALNPAIFNYHVRSESAVFNWYLYTYGLAMASSFIGGWLLAPPRQRALGLDARALLYILGVVLAFLLLNLEIADYFTSPGARSLTFQFSGDFARDMSYTIAWALFALGLLIVGIWKKTRSARYAGIALLGIALLKLFLHDLAQLAQLYRIGALFAVAVIAILASLAYQRFLPNHE